MNLLQLLAEKGGIQDREINFAPQFISDGGYLVRKLPLIAVATVCAAVAGTAVAAGQKTHRMDVPLPDGAVVHVEYAGDVAPKVTVAPVQERGLWAPIAFPGFANFDAIFDQLNRQMQQVQTMVSYPGASGMNVAAYGDMPQGSSSISVISTSNGGVSCTRTTEVVSQGEGKPPKVTTNVSGNCGSAPQAAPQAAPSGGSGLINHT